jgi:hypothetical protein
MIKAGTTRVVPETPIGAGYVGGTELPPVRVEPLPREDFLTAALATAGLAAGAVAPPIAILGGGISLGFSQTIKSVKGGGLLTPEEAIQATGGGAAFSVVAGPALSPLKGIAGVPGVVARVGAMTALGAGGGAGFGAAEAWAQRADIGEGVKAGALTGAAFGAAFGVASEVASYMGGRYVKPRVETQLSESYRQTLETGELWKPTLKERVLMRLTGAEPRSPELQAEATELLSESYKAQFKLSEAILKGEPIPEATGRTGLEPWTPTPKEIEIMRVTGVAPRVPAESINVARVAGGEALSLSGLQRQLVAEDIFEFSLTPKATMRMEVVKPTVAAEQVQSPVTRTLFWRAGVGVIIDPEFTHEIARAETAEETRQTLINQGIPESQQAYDYRGPLSFQKPTTVTPTAPTEPAVPKGVGLEPFRTTTGTVDVAKMIGGYEQSIARAEARYGLGGGIVDRPSTILKTVTKAVQPSPSVFPISGATIAQSIARTGKPYYTMPREAVEEQVTYISVPESGLSHPQQPKFITDVTQKAQQEPYPSVAMPTQPSLFATQLTRGGLITKPAESLTQIPIVAPTQRQQPSQIPELIAIPRQAPVLIPATIPRQKPTTATPPPFPLTKSQLGFPFMIPGAKAPEFGGNRFEFPTFEGILSIKRQYPIKTPEEFWSG